MNKTYKGKKTVALQIRELVDDGLSVDEITERLGCKRGYVAEHVKKYRQSMEICERCGNKSTSRDTPHGMVVFRGQKLCHVCLMTIDEDRPPYSERTASSAAEFESIW